MAFGDERLQNGDVVVKVCPYFFFLGVDAVEGDKEFGNNIVDRRTLANALYMVKHILLLGYRCECSGSHIGKEGLKF